jgi:hypothetical protein
LTGIADPTNLRMPYRIYTRRKILTKKLSGHNTSSQNDRMDYACS